jgi:GNAT superfamily N-acetyltransferase
VTSPPLDLEIHPLNPDRFADVAALFAQGGDPKWCWCAFWRVRGLDWTNATADSNRERLRKLAKRTPAPGLVAYLDGEPVGWVGVGPRQTFDRLQHSKVLAPIDDKPVWSIVCFVVGRRHRGKGVARALLDAAIAYARDHGATLLEGYPADTSAGRVSAAAAYKGTVGMFEEAGFEVIEKRQWNRTSPVRPIVRRSVRPGRDRR